MLRSFNPGKRINNGTQGFSRTDAKHLRLVVIDKLRHHLCAFYRQHLLYGIVVQIAGRHHAAVLQAKFLLHVVRQTQAVRHGVGDLYADHAHFTRPGNQTLGHLARQSQCPGDLLLC